MKKKSVLSLLLAAALALSLTGCELPWKLGEKEPVVNSDGTITKEENGVKITETAAKSVETELYETADFSLQIPKGWTVTSGGNGHVPFHPGAGSQPAPQPDVCPAEGGGPAAQPGGKGRLCV